MRQIQDALLEKIISRAQTTPHPSPFDKTQLPWYEGPWFDVARAAVESLHDTKEIREFMKDYARKTKEDYGLTEKRAGEAVRSAIGYCTGYVDDEQANVWFNALPDISHPVTGRKRPFAIDGEVEMFYLVGKSGDKEVREYIIREFEGGLLGLRLANPGIVQGRDNPEYFAIRLKMPQGKFGATNYYMFLAGFALGIPDRIKKDLGKRCTFVCEIKKKKQSEN